MGLSVVIMLHDLMNAINLQENIDFYQCRLRTESNPRYRKTLESIIQMSRELQNPCPSGILLAFQSTPYDSSPTYPYFLGSTCLVFPASTLTMGELIMDAHLDASGLNGSSVTVTIDAGLSGSYERLVRLQLHDRGLDRTERLRFSPAGPPPVSGASGFLARRFR